MELDREEELWLLHDYELFCESEEDYIEFLAYYDLYAYLYRREVELEEDFVYEEGGE